MEVDEVRRRQWLRALRSFKQGIKLRAKMGVLQTLCEQVAKERRKQQFWDAPQWEHEEWVVVLYEAIRDEQFPTELLVGFVKTAEITFLSPRKQPTVEGTIAAVDVVCKRLSVKLRRKFGVLR
jgi:hypothetical protein